MAQTIDQFYWGFPAKDIFEPIESFEIDEKLLSRRLCEAVLTGDPDNVPALTVLAEACTRSGEYERGLTLDLRLTRLSPGNPIAWYNLGCSYSLLGDLSASVEALRQSLDVGYTDIRFMQTDPDLEAVRSHPRFAELMIRTLRRDAE